MALATASGASAQTRLPAPIAAAPDAKTKQQAKTAFMQAKQLYKLKQYEKAAEYYQKADDLVPAPTPKFYIAQAWDKAGKVFEAVAAYDKFIEAASIDKERYGEKITEAEGRLKELRPQTQAKVAITLDPPVPGAMMEVDGKPVEGTSISLGEGKYTLTVSAPGYQTQTKDIEVVGPDGAPGEGTFAAGGEGTVTLSLEEEQVAAAPPPIDGGETPDTDDEEGGGSGLFIPGVIVGGVGLVGVGVGAAFGAMALGSASDFDETPTEELADDAESQALISDLGIIIGGAAVAAGITLIVIDLVGGDSTEEQAVTVVPMVGPDTQGVSTVIRF